jgi:hypothetical protein
LQEFGWYPTKTVALDALCLKGCQITKAPFKDVILSLDFHGFFRPGPLPGILFKDIP